MSLTSFLKNKDVKEKFAQNFPMPKFRLRGKLKAPPKTNHYSLVGTGFDYLMRFYLKKINPSATTQKWVAETAIDWAPVNDKKILEKFKNILTNSKKIYAKYLKTGKINKEVIKSCLLLAQLDPIYRRGTIGHNIGAIDSEDIKDLKNLIQLVNQKKFQCKNCVLNPTFGEASILRADADILCDDTLIDIKTTKFLNLNRNNYNQIIGYYILFLISKIDNAPKNTKIKFIGIYFSRYGLLYKIPITKVTENCNLPKFIKWFKKRAERRIFIRRLINIKK